MTKNYITIQDFKKLAKKIAVKFGYKKGDVSITTDSSVIRVDIKNLVRKDRQFYEFRDEIKSLAGEGSNSDGMKDYFDNYTCVNKYEWGCAYEYIFVNGN